MQGKLHGGFKMNASEDRIELVLPFKPEYVSVARLTVSGIANRMGYDIETIEDIKVAVAEVCNKIVGIGKGSSENYSIAFGVNSTRLEITFYSQVKGMDCIFREADDELGISIIKAFMDSVEFCPDNTYILSMTKSFEGISEDGE
jgi:serine/threonine-protein kinase RsbW